MFQEAKEAQIIGFKFHVSSFKKPRSVRASHDNRARDIPETRNLKPET